MTVPHSSSMHLHPHIRDIHLLESRSLQEFTIAHAFLVWYICMPAYSLSARLRVDDKLLASMIKTTTIAEAGARSRVMIELRVWGSFEETALLCVLRVACCVFAQICTLSGTYCLPFN